MYSAQHANVPVTAGQCYWLEISNKIGDPDAMDLASSWFWEFAATSATAPLYSGNGRLAIDGSPPDGYDDIDIVAATDRRPATAASRATTTATAASTSRIC